MKKTLRHCDIVIGHKYKVVKVPERLKGINWPWLNLTGVAKWVNVSYNDVCMVFGECKERSMPPDCLEEVEGQQMIINSNKPNYSVDPDTGLIELYKQFGKEKDAENKLNGIVNEHTAKLDQLYRIIKVPEYWKRLTDPKEYPSLGRIGRLIKINHEYGTLKLSDGMQRFVPFTCIELVTVRIPPVRELIVNLNDEELIARMLTHPKGTLKIIKGLAKMNKDYRLRAFLERGVVF